MAKNVKKRYWAFVLYPESAPEEWRQILTETGLECAISPLHDKDINPDGTPKKAHYHVILCYAGPTTYNCVKTLTESLNQPVPQPIEQVKGYYRYFSHKDNPEKYQYSESVYGTDRDMQDTSVIISPEHDPYADDLIKPSYEGCKSEQQKIFRYKADNVFFHRILSSCG